MGDPVSITAGVVGLLAFARSTLTRGYSILQSLQDSKNDVNQLPIQLSQLTGILMAIEAQKKRQIKESIQVKLELMLLLKPLILQYRLAMRC